MMGSSEAAPWPVPYHHLHPAEAPPQPEAACCGRFRATGGGSGSNSNSCSSSSRVGGAPLSTVPSLTESEEDQLRRLEEEILEAAATATKAPAATRSAAAALLRRGRRDRQWKHRILAVAAFKTEGARRRLIEEDILSVAASVCSEMGSCASGCYSLDEAPSQPQQPWRLGQSGSTGPLTVRSGGGGGGAAADGPNGRWSAPVYGRNRGVFTDEDEDVMNKILGGPAT